MNRAIGKILSLLVPVLVVLTPAAAEAKGGWAVAVLDPLPPIEAGEDASIGFQLLQHGVTPVDAADWPGARIGVAVRTAGSEWFAPATPTGAPGHFVAVVGVPADATALSLNVAWPDGLMIDEHWIDVAVGAAAARAGGVGGDGWLPTWTVPLLAVLVAACIVVIVLDVRRGRAVA